MPKTALTNFVSILAANAILGCAMPMLIILGGLAGLLLAPTPILATLPPSIQMLAGLVVAAPISLFMGKYGRRTGFFMGAMFAIVGGVVGVISLYANSIVGLCIAHGFLGGSLACFNYFRFAAGEAVPEKWQSVAISFTLGSGLIAALVGPEVFNQTKDLLQPVPLAGAYGAICILSVIGSIPLIFLKLDQNQNTESETSITRQSAIQIIKRPKVSIAILAASISSAVMILLMAPTPLAMVGHGYEEKMASDVIRWHVVAMFAPSFFTGFLINRFGLMMIIYAGIVLLAGSAFMAIAGMTPHHFYLSLILLGVGWNFGFIGGTTLLAKELSEGERPKVQGINDTLVALAGSASAFASGAVVAKWGWVGVATSALPALVVTLVLIIILQRLSITFRLSNS